MKPTPLLDFWQKPPHAGAPVAAIATTFALEPDFFEQNCLARFLEVSSVNEDTQSIDDIVANVELHELLQNTRVSVLADRSAPVQRTSLLWDLLSCRADGGGLLHAKVAVLLWENKTRVILGSANLTSAGYRRQIELGLAADLGPGCLFPNDVLTAIADELDSYLHLVPGFDAQASVFARATGTLALFRQRIAQQRQKQSDVRVAFAPTNAKTGALDALNDVWAGSRPIHATHLSPFWDSADPTALKTVARLLTGQPAADRSHNVAVVLGPRGQTSFSKHLGKYVNPVRQLKKIDNEMRTLHAKCLLIEGRNWIAALVGSSNHTKAGLGLGTGRRHREMNVWLGAPRDSKAGRALRELIELGEPVPDDAEEVDPKDEDEAVLPSLPACFGLCRIVRSNDGHAWELHLGVNHADDMPASWGIHLAAGEKPVLTRSEWQATGARSTYVIALSQQYLPMVVFVTWDHNQTPWAVLAEDRHGLPPGPELAQLRAQHLLDALANGRSLAQVLREELERQRADEEEKEKNNGIDLDPLKRHEVQGSLLRRGRALAVSLSAMQRRLERPVLTSDMLRARLMSPLGPEFVSSKIVEAALAEPSKKAEALFTLAEIILSFGRVDWAQVVEHIDRDEGMAIVNDLLDRLDAHVRRVGNEPADLASYARRATEMTRQCLCS
jgi:hypothetical protein